MPSSETTAIRIVVNGESHTVPRGQTVVGLLEALNLDPSRVAVELNRRIVKPAQWAETVLDAGAELEIVRFVGGG